MKKLQGTVISNKMQKTVTVLTQRFWQHPKYQKRVKKNKKYLAHTDKDIEIGKKVIIAETKPISKNKTWKVLEIIK